MKKIVYILILILTLSSFPTYSKAKSGSLTGKLMFASVLLLGGVVAKEVWMAKYTKYKEEHASHDISDFVDNFPELRAEIENGLRAKMKNAKSEKVYINLQKVADLIRMSDVPPFEPEDMSKYKLPGMNAHPYSNINKLETPEYVSEYPNILISPEGEPVDTSLEFPIERPKDWNEYILLKQASKELAENMANDNVNKKGVKPAGYAAHHIVPFSEDRGFSQPYADNIRKILKNVGIGLNDSENGVYLRHLKKLKNTTSESYHPEIHTKKYYEAVFLRLQPLSGNKVAIEKELSKIASELKNKTFPY